MRQLTRHEVNTMLTADRARRNAKLQRDHELELMLNAGVTLAEAINLVPQA
jgi:hypothetical protein